MSTQSRSKIKYYDLCKNWRKVKQHLDNPRVANTLVRDFNKYTYGRWRQRFTAGRYPCEFESCDWALERRGRHPHPRDDYMLVTKSLVYDPDDPWDAAGIMLDALDEIVERYGADVDGCGPLDCSCFDHPTR